MISNPNQNPEPSQNCNKPESWFKRGWPLGLVCCLVIVLLILPFLIGKWAWQPVAMIFIAVVATQIGSIFARTTLKRLVETLTYHETHKPDVDDDSEEDKEKLKIIKGCVEDRLHGSKKNGHSAVDSYLNQVAGSWAMALLGFGIASLILIRGNCLGVQNPPGVIIFAMCAIGAIVFLLVWLGSTGVIGTKKIIIYYDHKKIIPPSGALTFFRVAVLIIYCVVVFAAFWPISNPESNQNNTEGKNVLSATTNASAIYPQVKN